MQRKNHYIVLGIASNASFQEIKSAYRKLAKKHHPDRNQNHQRSEEAFKEIQQAYSVLSDPSKRRNYDLTLPTHEKHFQFKQSRTQPSPYAFAQTTVKWDTENEATSGEKDIERRGTNDLIAFLISVLVAILLLLFIVMYQV